MQPRTMVTGPVRVMIVDDSVVVRGLIGRWIDEDPALAAQQPPAADQPKITVTGDQRITAVELDPEMLKDMAAGGETEMFQDMLLAASTPSTGLPDAYSFIVPSCVALMATPFATSMELPPPRAMSDVQPLCL